MYFKEIEADKKTSCKVRSARERQRKLIGLRSNQDILRFILLFHLIFFPWPGFFSPFLSSMYYAFVVYTLES